MLRIDGQTARRIGLNCFMGTHGWPGLVLLAKKVRNFLNYFFSKIVFQICFHGPATPGPSASY